MAIFVHLDPLIYLTIGGATGFGWGYLRGRRRRRNP